MGRRTRTRGGGQPELAQRPRPRQGPLDPGRPAPLERADPGARRAVEGARGTRAGPALEAPGGLEARGGPDAGEPVERRVGRLRRRRRPAVGLPAARGGRGDQPLEPALPVSAVADEPRPRGPDRPVAPERVVARRALEHVAERGARQVAARQRALGQHRRPQRLAHAHAGDPQLAEAARVRLAQVGMAHARDPHAQGRHAAQPDFEPVPAVVHVVRAAADLDRGHAAEPIRVRAAARPRRRRAGRRRRPRASARLRRARGRPASASPGRRRTRRTAAARGTAGTRATTVRAAP